MTSLEELNDKVLILVENRYGDEKDLDAILAHKREYMPDFVQFRMRYDFPCLYFEGAIYINLERATSEDIDKCDYRKDIAKVIKEQILRRKLKVFVK